MDIELVIVVVVVELVVVVVDVEVIVVMRVPKNGKKYNHS